MLLSKRTKSICSVCLKEVDALVVVNIDGVYLRKTCSEHGAEEYLIEKDPIYYMFCQTLNKGIYDAYVIETTDACNTKCKYCYYPTNQNKIHPPISDLVALAKEQRHLAPFMLIGGEPTMRDDLGELITELRQYGICVLVSNGIKLADEDYLNGLLVSGLIANGYATISISLHPKEHQSLEEYQQKITAIENVINKGLILESVIFVIDSLDEVDEALAFGAKYRGCIGAIRIKIASDIDKTTGVEHTMFASDIINYLQSKSLEENKSFYIDTTKPNIYSYCNVKYDDISYIVLNMPNKRTIDLNELDCPPYTHLEDGRLVNIAYALIRGDRCPHKPLMKEL